jgi:hypothetical protein
MFSKVTIPPVDLYDDECESFDLQSFWNDVAQAANKVSLTKPAAEPAAKPDTETAAKPVGEPVAKPAAKPAAKLDTELSNK